MVTTKILNNHQAPNLPLGAFAICTTLMLGWQYAKYSYYAWSKHNRKVSELCVASNDVAETHIDHEDPAEPNTNFVSNRTPYMVCVIAEVKNRFGRPQRNSANYLAVRKFTMDVMIRHGVRPTHINRMIDVVVGMVFVSNDNELYSDELLNSFEAAYRGGAGGLCGWVARWLRSISSNVDEGRI